MGEETPVYEHNVVNKGIDPLLLAALGGGTGGGMFGGNNGNMLWPLLFLFGRGYGGWGGAYGPDGASGSAFAARTLASEATMTAKDVTNQLSSFQHWCCENSGLLQQAINGIDKSLCCSTRDIMSAVNALTPQMYQSFATLTQGMNSGFAAQQLCCCQSTAAIQHALCEGFAAASRQGCQETAAVTQALNSGFSAVALAQCDSAHDTQNKIDSGIHQLETLNMGNFNSLTAQADRIALQSNLQTQAQGNALNLSILTNANAAALAACEIKNQLAACCCELKSSIHDDGALTRALITDNEMNNLRAKLADTKDALSNANQSILIGQQIQSAVGTIVQHLPNHKS